MKISNELRCTIRAAAKAQPEMSRWVAREEQKAKALNRFLKERPAIEVKVKNTSRKYKAAVKRLSELGSDHAHLGIRVDSGGGPYISDERKFVEAGGVIGEPKEVWVAEKVIAELAAADAAEGAKILKRIGIRWE